MSLKNKNLLIMVLAVALSIITYFLFREMYYSNSDFPYSQEILAALIGTVITILITSLLLNKQTEVEMLKEENLKILELKASIYNELFSYLEKVFLKQEVTKSDIIKLKLINQKLSTIASIDVLKIFEKFIEEFNLATKDKKILGDDIDDLLEILSSLSNAIRYDLLEGKHVEKASEKSEIFNQILKNTEKLEKNEV
ncbi:hypothetical protein HNP65_001018 [Thermosipho japonicus]|uniref:Uncharacterized protein n=1 Tax=Thermosipho japonicus TaxID=90323 RepID=A0A841GTE3_9BACT|nr:hypothetical protein [Thermosipho japonicus]MBB6062580.1 hypothetical protein [Thermosipho japonicus]